MKKWIAVLLLAVCSSHVAIAQLSPDTAAKIDALFAGRSSDEPGGVLEISRHGMKIYRKVFGVTNLEQPTPINGETIFHAASVSKQFTAAGILLLEKEGKLSLDDDVKKHIPEFPDYSQKVTIRHLLTHTSGLKDWWNVTYLSSWPTGYKVLDLSIALKYISRQTGLNYTPGERYSYTNTGYDLAAIIIERVTGKSFPSFVQERLLEPAGMTMSRFRGKFNEVIRGMATCYFTSGNKLVRADILNETTGAAGLLTTASDLTKWNYFINNVISSGGISHMREDRFVLNNGDTISYTPAGVNLNFINGVKEFSHSGLEGGFRSLCLFYPGQGLSVTYMSNIKDISTVELHKSIAEIFFGKSATEDILQKLIADTRSKKNGKPDLKDKTGVFLSITDESDFLKLHETNGKLMSYAAELEPKTGKVFVYGSNIYSFINRDTVKLYRGGVESIFYRVPLLQPTELNLTEFTGSYYSKEADVNLEFRLANGRLIAFRPAGDSVVLSPVFKIKDVYAFRGFNNGLRTTYYFEKPANKVQSLKLSIPRAYDIPFSRLPN